MSSESFLTALQLETQTLTQTVATEKGDWIVKGFIDVFQRIYTISVDTKVISKVLELLLFPRLVEFAIKNNYDFVLAPEQNFYPDITFVEKSTGEKHALDIKTTYRKDARTVNGMTLGAFTGYFRDRKSKKNIVFPYNQYSSHVILGVIYSKVDESINEREIYKFEDLAKINSVVKDFLFFAQPKYKIASALPGSGNTKNIGSVTRIEQLINGTGSFAELGEEVYDDYWMFYLTKDMARTANIETRPYWNLQTYALYKQKGVQIDISKAKELDRLDTGTGKDEE
jgi:Restriction endonuclease EcoRV